MIPNSPTTLSEEPSPTSESSTSISILADCEHCPFKGRPKVPGYGAPPDRCKAVIIGEAPGTTEAAKGRPFVGPSGRLLRVTMAKAGFDVLSCRATIETVLEEEPEVYFTNAALCLPLGRDADHYVTSDYKKLAAKRCFQRLKAELTPYAEAGVPLCAVGGSPSLVMVGSAAITKIRSRWFTKKDVRILTTWHPAYILRKPFRMGEFYRDMKKLRYGKPRWEDISQTPISIRETKTVGEVWELFRELASACARGEVKDSTICLDIESDNVRWWEDKILCYGFAWDVDKAAIIPEELVYHPGVRDAMIWLFAQPDIKFMGHNFKFDIRFIKAQTGVHNARVDYDSLIGDHVIDENRNHGLKGLMQEFYDIPDYEEALIKKYMKSRNDMYSKIPRPELYQYCAYDVVYTLRLWRDVRDQMESKGMFEKPFLFMMSTQQVFVDMELHGMLMDKDMLRELSIDLRIRLAEMHSELCQEAKVTDFNPNSPKQVSAIMYDVFAMPKQRVRGVGPRSTARPVRKQLMRHYKERGQEDCIQSRWIVLYDSWKSLEKIRSSYVDNMIPLIDAQGRVHPDMLVYGTESGRISVRSPALQTIPRVDTGRVEGEMWGRKIKQCFAAPPGYKIVGIDFSQAEIRTAAALANDSFLIKCFEEKLDIHGEVAEAYWPGWHDMEDKVQQKFLRKQVKMCVFGRMYLGTAVTIAETLGVTKREGVRKLAVLDELLGGLVKWEHAQFDRMKKTGYVDMPMGRRRRVPLVTRDNMDEARKAACNAPVQGTASDLTLLAAVETDGWLNERYGDARVRPYLIMLMHDELILEVPDHLVIEVALRVKEIMQEVGTGLMPQVPWVADIEVGDNWGEMKELTPKELIEEYRRPAIVPSSSCA